MFGNNNKEKGGGDDAKENNNDNAKQNQQQPSSSSSLNDENDKDDATTIDDDESEEEMSLSSFQQELANRQQQQTTNQLGGSEMMMESVEEEDDDDDEEFSGYDMRDIIFEKWGQCFDVEFQRVDSYGFRTVYLNILPFRLGGRTFRHETELDYLCHLQAVVEILLKYNQLGYILMQIDETKKKPRPNTSPLVAVPLRLELTPEQVDKILG